MQVRWGNIIALGVVFLALFIFIRHEQAIVGFFSGMRNIAPGHTPEEQAEGLVAFGIILVCILALFRLALAAQARKDK